MQAILEHTTTKFKRYLPDVDIKSEDFMFFSIELDTSKFTDGEYQLTIYTDRNELVGEEIIRIGEYKSEKAQYKVEKRFTQYVRK